MAVTATSFDAAVGSLRSVFQPVVELDTGDVSGYEALVRGPAGTSWERPDRLFAEARWLGMVHRLDWAARESAVAAARAHHFQLPLTLFVNAEPLAFGLPGEDEHWRSFGDLRCFVEITERALTHRPAALLRSIERVREQDWGIALDDIGSQPESLALMPLLRPDVLKLDLRVLARRPDRVSSGVVHAVMTQAADTGASVVAEGIEDERQLDLARGYGVHLGQGYLLGRPGDLPEELATPRRAVPMLDRTSDKAVPPSPFALLAAMSPVRSVSGGTVLELVRQLFVQAGTLRPAPVVLLQLPDGHNLTPLLQRQLASLARTSPLVTVLGGGTALARLPDVPTAPLSALDGGDRAVQTHTGDIAVAVVGSFFSAALAVRPAPDDRSYDAALVFDRSLACRLATTLFTRLPSSLDDGPRVPGAGETPDELVSRVG